jgi:hypothetical protein
MIKQIFKSKKYDWVFEHLKSDVKPEVSPYLWTRIKTRLESQQDFEQEPAHFFSEVLLSLRWSLPFLLIISVSCAVFIGVELSRDFRNLIHRPDNLQIYQMKESPSDPLLDDNLYKTIPSLKPEDGLE